MTEFAPIAIVGRSCLLPGAANSAQLWLQIASGKDLLTDVTPESWGVSSAKLHRLLTSRVGDHVSNGRAGFVKGFEQLFQPSRYGKHAAMLSSLAPIYQWAVWSAHQALADANIDIVWAQKRAGLVLGSLGLPTPAMGRYGRSVWLGGDEGPALDRFCFGSPAQYAANVLKLGLGGFAMDAACASSLFAIKLACDRLQDGDADLMVAGGIHSTDGLYLHQGFTAMNALSPTGQSRPFHKDADGLVPSEGAAVVVLKRLQDAVNAGDRIYGVIRGIGLSNDGRSQGMLVPSESGQIRAIRAAYEMSGFTPSDIGLIECHATGTSVGDNVELKTLRQVFGDKHPLVLTSLKSNIGHPITASGAAGLIKLTEALTRATLPPSRTAQDLLPAFDETAYRVLKTPEPWDGSRPRRAAINAFGFGGNNAHLIVEAWEEANKTTYATARKSPAQAKTEEPLVVVGMSVLAGKGAGLHDFLRDVLGPTVAEPPQDYGQADEIRLPLKETRFPPNDLKQTLSQQLMLLAAAQQAVHDAGRLDGLTAGVFMGMEVDPEIARLDLRWRLEEILAEKGIHQPEAWLRGAADSITPAVDQPSRVIGFLSNFPANRLSSQFNLCGPGFTVGAGEESGYLAYTLAARALRKGEIDVALVGAVDLSCHEVHRQAIRSLTGDPLKRMADAAVVFVLQRQKDAEELGARIHAILPGESAWIGSLASVGDRAVAVYGESYAAKGLMHLATAVLAAKYGTDVPRTAGVMRPWLPSGKPRGFQAVVGASGQTMPSRIQVLPATAEAPHGLLLDPAPVLFSYSGRTRVEVLDALQQERQSLDGPARLVFVAGDGATAARLKRYALDWLRQEDASSKLPPGLHYAESSMTGELAFVYTGAAAAYYGMGDRLMVALPELAERLRRRVGNVQSLAGWIYDRPKETQPSLEQQLRGSSALAQIHTELTVGLLGLKPHAVMGISSGETNSFFAMGAWQGIDEMFDQFVVTGYYDRETAGSFECAKRAWKLGTDELVRWSNLRVMCPVERLREVLVDEPRVHILIVHTQDDCLMGGDEQACQRVLERLGNPPSYPTQGHIVHCEEMREFASEWRKVHSRPTVEVPDVRFYSNALGDSFALSQDAVADNLLSQAVGEIDFPRTVLKSYEDGVRIFVEHGPRSACSGWISKILGDRPHLAISLDHAGRSSVDQAAHAIAALVAHGVACDHEAFFQRLKTAQLDAVPSESGPMLRFPAHQPPVSLPEFVPMPAVALERDAPAQAVKTVPSLVSEAPAKAQPTAIAPSCSALQPTLPRASRMQPAPPLPLWQANPADISWAHAETRHGFAMEPTQHEPVAFDGSDAIEIGEERRLPHFAHDIFWEVHRRTLQGHIQALAITHEYTHKIYEGLTCNAWTPTPTDTELYLAPIASSSLDGTYRLETTVHAVDMVHVANPETTHEAPATAPAPVADGILERYPVAETKAVRLETPASPVVSTPPLRAMIRDHRIALSDGAAAVGRCFTREQLDLHARGRVSALFGSAFDRQDSHRVVVRMPYGPMLLADRVTGVQAEIGVLGVGTLWTESDVREDSWFVHERRIPLGPLMESGQADLFLISYMGVDLLLQQERRYRMLSGELCMRGPLPTVGDTLCYEIQADSHMNLGDMRMFSFRFDCRIGGEIRLTLRNAVAGFFTDQELNESKGVLWSPDPTAAFDGLRLDRPLLQPATRYSSQQVAAFRKGNGFDCFGSGYELLATHTMSPKIGSGKLDLFDEVLELDVNGGPWKRGFVRAVKRITGEEWFFDGHFKNDPCMAGTLMIESSQQVVSFFMAAIGYTLNKDGWHFEPIPDDVLKFRCQAQCTPRAREVMYEVFVREVIDGPQPMIRADVLGIIDGVKGLLGENVGVKLVPDWPKGRQPVPRGLAADRKPCIAISGKRLDPDWMYVSAMGRLGELGKRAERFDGGMRTPRLPASPYLFLSRVIALDAEEESFKLPAEIVTEYEVPADAWYFEGSQRRRMPLCVLMEAALQPCGLLSNHFGYSTREEIELFYRNLDGSIELFEPVTPADEIVQMCVKAKSISRIGAMTLLSFDVVGSVKDRTVLKMSTGFGYFSDEALAGQTGIGPTAQETALFERPSNVNFAVKELRAQVNGPNRFSPLPSDRLGMLDRVTGLWQDQGDTGLGCIRGEKDVDPNEWFFKAHFFTDPVMPGTLGVHSILELIEFYMLQTGLDEGMVNPFFEVVTAEQPLKWKYRGEVRPTRKRMVVLAEIVSVERSGLVATATAHATLWIDGVCVYRLESFAVRLADQALAGFRKHRKSLEISPEKDPWILDHRPNMVVPVLPMMTVADSMAATVQEMDPARVVTAVRDNAISRWILVDQPRSFRMVAHDRESAGEPRLCTARLEMAIARAGGDMDWESVATCSVETAERYPEPPQELPPLQDAVPVEVIYKTREGFHGEAFHLKRSLRYGRMGSSAILDASGGSVPLGLLHPALLDCVYHSVPLHNITEWMPHIKRGVIALPSRIESLRLYGPAPVSGEVRCEVRMSDHEEGSKFIYLHAQYLVQDRVWAEIDLVNVLVDASHTRNLSSQTRWDYLSHRKFVPDKSFSEVRGDTTVLSYQLIPKLDWIPGAVGALYEIKGDNANVARTTVVKEHVGRQAEIHPAFVQVSSDLKTAVPDNQPYTQYEIDLTTEQFDIQVRNASAPHLELGRAARFWQQKFLAEPSAAEDNFFTTLCHRFLDRVQLLEPAAMPALLGRPVLYLANRETVVEQFLAAALLPPLLGTSLQMVFDTPPETIVCRALQAVLGAWTGDSNPSGNLLVLPGPESVESQSAQIAGMLRTDRLSMVLPWASSFHACAGGAHRKGIEALVETAIATSTPIVPLRMVSPAYVSSDEKPLDFPVVGQLRMYLGGPVMPAGLSALHPTERFAYLAQAMQALETETGSATPNDQHFRMLVQNRMKSQSLPESLAVLMECGLPA